MIKRVYKKSDDPLPLQLPPIPSTFISYRLWAFEDYDRELTDLRLNLPGLYLAVRKIFGSHIYNAEQLAQQFFSTSEQGFCSIFFHFRSL